MILSERKAIITVFSLINEIFEFYVPPSKYFLIKMKENDVQKELFLGILEEIFSNDLMNIQLFCD